MLHGASLLALIVLLVIGLAAVSGRGESPIVRAWAMSFIGAPHSSLDCSASLRLMPPCLALAMTDFSSMPCSSSLP